MAPSRSRHLIVPRHRRQLAHPRRGSTARSPDQWVLARETCHHIAQHHRGGAPRGGHPRQRPAGRVHPAPIGARPPRAARGAARLVRRRHAGRDRLHDSAVARQRVPPARHARGWRWPWSHRWRSTRQPGLRAAQQADWLVHGRGDRAGHARRRTAGPSPRTPAAGGGAWCPARSPLAIVEMEAIRHLRRRPASSSRPWAAAAFRCAAMPAANSRRRGGDRQGPRLGLLASDLLGADQFVISTSVRAGLLEFRQARPAPAGPHDASPRRNATSPRGTSRGQHGAEDPGNRQVSRSGGRRAIVTCPADLEDAIAGHAGTEFVAG